ncbi:unnamed protein product [Scytosiphon promiscuus]
MVGTGEALLSIRAKGGSTSQADGKGAATVSTAQEFDFQGELQKFDKEKELAKEMDGLSLGAQTSRSSPAAGSTGADAVKKYNKSSFFDEISCDVLDRAAGRPPRVTRAAEMDMNMDTFGTTGLQHARRRGGRGQNRNRSGGGAVASAAGQGGRGGVGAGNTAVGVGGSTIGGKRGGGGGGSGGGGGGGRGGSGRGPGGGGRSSGRGGYTGAGKSDAHVGQDRRGGTGQGRPRPRGGRGRGGQAGQSQRSRAPVSASQSQAV